MFGHNKLFHLICVISFFWGDSASASDGVLEINHACAVNGGCFNGDSAGYPISIDGSAGKSYQLTSDLVVPDEDTHGILVTAPGISIDLKGFEIIRSGCVGATTNCTPPLGGGSGVFVTGGSIVGVSVKNGTITGMSFDGATLFGNQAQVSGLRVRWNSRSGIIAGRGSVVSGNSAYENGGSGIVAIGYSNVSGNTAYGNGGSGIEIDASSKARGNVSGENGLADICGGGICSEQRRYYKSLVTNKGDAALTSCALGFHMASLWEIFDTSNLQYDTVLGRVQEDSGGGPPAGFELFDPGWVRTGAQSSNANEWGVGNCEAWSSNDSILGGSAAYLLHSWADAQDPTAQVFGEWQRVMGNCIATLPSWCIED